MMTIIIIAVIMLSAIPNVYMQYGPYSRGWGPYGGGFRDPYDPYRGLDYGYPYDRGNRYPYGRPDWGSPYGGGGPYGSRYDRGFPPNPYDRRDFGRPFRGGRGRGPSNPGQAGGRGDDFGR